MDPIAQQSLLDLKLAVLYRQHEQDIAAEREACAEIVEKYFGNCAATFEIRSRGEA